MAIITKEEYEKGKFIDLKECISILDINESNFRTTCKEKNIEKYKLREGSITFTYYKKENIDKIKEEQEEFLSKHISVTEAQSLISSRGISKLKRIKTPHYARCKNLKCGGICISKEDISDILDKGVNIKKTKLEEFNCGLEGFYTFDEARTLLNISITNLKHLIGTGEIRRAIHSGATYYNKVDVDKFLQKQQKEINEYINFDDAKKEYGRRLIDRVTRYDIPYYLRVQALSKRQSMYKIEELETVKTERENKGKFYNEVGKNATDLFLNRINVYEGINLNEFKSKCPFSYNEWFNYLKTKLNYSNASDKTLDVNTRYYTFLTQRLISVLRVEGNLTELYLLSTTDIIDKLYILNKTDRRALIKFFSYIYTNIKVQMNKEGIYDKKLFDIVTIKKRFEENKDKTLLSAKIYSIEEYTIIFDYCIDIKKHTINSILEIENDKKAQYVSAWLYSLLHLNNAWRHEDVSNFKSININDLIEKFKIWDLNWFNYNEIDLAKARMIISRVLNSDFIISKTQMQGHFFCSDDIAPSVATAIVILTLFNEKNKVVSNSEEPRDLMKFETKFNDPTKAILEIFFKGIKIEEFKFSSRKMNATLMTYIYSITVKDCGDKALKFISTLRGHVNYESSLHYLNINDEDIFVLSKQLFDRGEFGYIYSKLVESMNNDIKSSDRELITSEITNIKLTLGKIFNIENLSGFMNSYSREKRKILNELEHKTFEEKVQLLNDICISNMPSKEMNIQCLFGANNCPYNKSDCVYCAYSIPSIYALHEICKSFLSNVKLYHEETLIGEKIRLSVKINHEVEVISEAIKHFGKDIVFEYMGISYKEFKRQYISVEYPDTLYDESCLI